MLFRSPGAVLQDLGKAEVPAAKTPRDGRGRPPSGRRGAAPRASFRGCGQAPHVSAENAGSHESSPRLSETAKPDVRGFSGKCGDNLFSPWLSHAEGVGQAARGEPVADPAPSLSVDGLHSIEVEREEGAGRERVGVVAVPAPGRGEARPEWVVGVPANGRGAGAARAPAIELGGIPHIRPSSIGSARENPIERGGIPHIPPSSIGSCRGSPIELGGIPHIPASSIGTVARTLGVPRAPACQRSRIARVRLASPCLASALARHGTGKQEPG